MSLSRWSSLALFMKRCWILLHRSLFMAASARHSWRLLFTARWCSVARMARHALIRRWARRLSVLLPLARAASCAPALTALAARMAHVSQCSPSAMRSASCSRADLFILIFPAALTAITRIKLLSIIMATWRRMNRASILWRRSSAVWSWSRRLYA